MALIHVLIGYEAVHLRAERDGLEQRYHDYVEHGEGKVRLRGVAPGKVCVYVGQINAL